jgi:hypothetical protein
VVIPVGILAVVCFSALLVGCRGEEIGSLEQISIVKYRYVMDDSEDVVRVVGLARNTGERPTPEAEVIATLRSRTGSFKGQNRVALPSLPAGEEQQFALAVNSHGSVEAIDMEVVEPGTITEEGAQQPEDDSEEDEDDGA